MNRNKLKCSINKLIYIISTIYAFFENCFLSCHHIVDDLCRLHLLLENRKSYVVRGNTTFFFSTNKCTQRVLNWPQAVFLNLKLIFITLEKLLLSTGKDNYACHFVLTSYLFTLFQFQTYLYKDNLKKRIRIFYDTRFTLS